MACSAAALRAISLLSPGNGVSFVINYGAAEDGMPGNIQESEQDGF